MGCGNSVLNGNNDAIPAKLIPFLHHPIDEINKRRRTNAMKEISPSKKELLVDGEANIDSFDHASGARKSVSEGLREFTERVDDHGAETGRRDGKVPEKNEEANEDEGMDLREDGITYPGSPSFRVYCLGDNNNNNNDNHSDHHDGDDDNDDDDHDCHDGDRIGADKTPSSNDLEASSADKDSEESMPKNGKRGRKIRNLKKAISIGKHTAAVKNIFNVRSCYMSSSSSQRNHPGHA